MFILKKGHQPGVYVPLRALFLVLTVLPEFPMSESGKKVSGTGAIRNQILPSKPKTGIPQITNSQNTKRTYDQPSRQLFTLC